MPDPDLDEVDRKIREAKDLAQEVRQPGTEPGAVGAADSSAAEPESADEEGTASS